MLVTFYRRPKETGKAEDGLPLFTDVVFVKIYRDPTLTIDRPAKDEDIERFQAQYNAFLKATADIEEMEEGTPLEMWPVASPADVESFKSRGVRTVQSLATFSKTKLPPSVAVLVDKAAAYVKAAKNDDPLSKIAELEDELAEAAKENKQLKSRLAKLQEKVDAA